MLVTPVVPVLSSSCGSRCCYTLLLVVVVDNDRVDWVFLLLLCSTMSSSSIDFFFCFSDVVSELASVGSFLVIPGAFRSLLLFCLLVVVNDFFFDSSLSLSWVLSLTPTLVHRRLFTLNVG
jgi:hypothetical protein